MLDWHSIMDSWDTQQTNYLPAREERFTIMLDILELHFGEKFTVLDLACGTGSISGRVLERFPQASCIAADLDPVLMQLGKQRWDFPERLQWLDVNLSHPDWSVDESKPLEWLKTQKIDAILTTTALHWLNPHDLVRVYLQLADLQAEGGILMNGDNIMFLPHMRTFGDISDRSKAQRQYVAFEEQGGEDYQTWWNNLREQLLQDDSEFYGQLLQERDRRFEDRQRDFSEPIRVLHEAALSNAGYTEVAPIWQRFDNCVLLAIKGAEIASVKN